MSVVRCEYNLYQLAVPDCVDDNGDGVTSTADILVAVSAAQVHSI